MTDTPYSSIAHPKEIRDWHDAHYRRTSPETSPGTWVEFQDVPDPYNPGNTVTGYIQRHTGDEYGTLILTHVNGRPAPQRIAATPKASYPYHPDGRWLMQSAQSVRAYIKYDGTNVCQYSYQDADGNRHTTFKLRIRPFVSPRFQPLIAVVLSRYPAVRNLRMEQDEAMLYELYGRDNLHMFQYDVDISLISLCRRNPGNGDLEPPDPDDPNFARLDCPLAEPTSPLSQDWTNIRQEYTERQTGHSNMLVHIGMTEDEQPIYRGNEGEMLYATFAQGDRTLPGTFTRMLKLKPPEVEEIHRSPDFISKLEIQATMRNIFEASDDPTVDDLVSMLEEEWNKKQINNSMDVVQRTFEAAMESYRMEQQVLNTYRENFRDESFRKDGPAVMRQMSKHFSRHQMGLVYSILSARLPLPPQD